MPGEGGGSEQPDRQADAEGRQRGHGRGAGLRVGEQEVDHLLAEGRRQKRNVAPADDAPELGRAPALQPNA